LVEYYGTISFYGGNTSNERSRRIYLVSMKKVSLPGCIVP
jgi:NADPH-dependent curcumin reductase CurA